ncbi:hypothetical protein L6R53_15810 [Myxococcota bacterium]|nr:hypothetical protein [Myxococcota bacterium]
MSFMKFAAAVLNQGASTNQAVTGATMALKPAEDEVLDKDQGWSVLFNLVASGGTSPTLDAKLQTSWDKTTWVDVDTMTQLVGAGTQIQVKDISAKTIGPFVRGILTPGGTAAPNVTGTIILLSNARFNVGAAQ